MPDLPAPYEMRNWKEVTLQYDAFIFDRDKTGQHLPLINIKPNGNNYPELEPILLKTYVGAPGATQAEAINIIPAIVGASLMDIDKSNQEGINWVEKVKDFFNIKNNQKVYLNGYNASSGKDWWYDLMPNVFFYQLYSLYPSIAGFDEQFVSVADQWLKAVYAMGGKATPWTIPQMNYRGWNLSTMTGNTEGVKEPESAGTISWLLYSAYQQTGEKKYLEGAQLALDYLSQLNANPSYELQLPYGTLTAAKLNAEHGANYPIGKMLDWSFDKGELRGWGTIVGTWDNHDISGLIGEANDNGNDYAFMMNGYQQAAALVPLVKYDKRYAKAIAKWTINLANASRLFYPQYLDAGKQDDNAWSNLYDPQSVIGYEAIKETWEGKSLYGTGDAKRSGWAETNLALYGSSHVGYLAAVAEETDVEGILKLNLNKTDFFGDTHFPSFLFYNPHLLDQQVTLNLDTHSYDLYDAISETVIATDVTGAVQVPVKAGEVILLKYLPSGIDKTIIEGKLYGDDHIIDHHYGYDFDPIFRIKSFATENERIEFNQEAILFAETENATAALVYNWYVDDVLYAATNVGNLVWDAPETEGEYKILVEIFSGSERVMDSLYITVLEKVPYAPVINSIHKDQIFYPDGSMANINCIVEGSETEELTYTWTVPSGTFEQEGSHISWTVPDVEGLYALSCVVKNNFDLSSEAEVTVLVKKEGEGPTAPLAYYPFNINIDDYSGNNFHANSNGTKEAADALGNPASAYAFSSVEDIIFVENKAALNFQDATTLSFWISAGNTNHEAFILSHGSWEERWKVSITPNRNLRWTIKTDEGVKDVDSSFPLEANRFYHVTVVYSGYSIEVYMDGLLDTYIQHDGLILTTQKAITFGQKGQGETQFYLNGVLDEVRIYDKALNPDEISTLKTLWNEEPLTANEEIEDQLIKIFPNPSMDGQIVISHPSNHIHEVQLRDVNGKSIPVSIHSTNQDTHVKSQLPLSGLFILQITFPKETRSYKVIFP